MRTKQELTEAIKRDRRAALVVNAHSRQGMRLYDAARACLLAAGFTVLDAYPVDRPAELEATLTAALDRGPDLLVAGGGDGTISTAARLLAHRDIALGLPGLVARRLDASGPHLGKPALVGMAKPGMGKH